MRDLIFFTSDCETILRDLNIKETMSTSLLNNQLRLKINGVIISTNDCEYNINTLKSSLLIYKTNKILGGLIKL